MEKQGKKKLTVREDVIANKEEFAKIYKKLNVLARSRPEDKVNILKNYQFFYYFLFLVCIGCWIKIIWSCSGCNWRWYK